VAVLLAGGTGTRVGHETPKQLLMVAGKTLLEHSIAPLQASDLIDEIIIVMTPGYTDQLQGLLGDTYPKVSKIVDGGQTRNESTRLALAALGDGEANVLVHDANRPLLDQRIVTECVEALARYDAVDVGIPCADTIIEVQDDRVVSIPDRSRLRRGQTPQAFRLSTLRQAYRLAAGDPGFTATDDCGVVLRFLPETPIYVVDGTQHNVKVTHPIDLFLIEQLLELAASAQPAPGGGDAAGVVTDAERVARALAADNPEFPDV
jgi:2-C-methyl-D-erythritol 4-phosphate cytidylyltransferase